MAGYSVPGVTYPTARITGIKEISCEGLSGSTRGADACCADVTSELLEGDDKGKAVTVPITAAIYSSGSRSARSSSWYVCRRPETSRPSTSSLTFSGVRHC